MECFLNYMEYDDDFEGKKYNHVVSEGDEECVVLTCGTRCHKKVSDIQRRHERNLKHPDSKSNEEESESNRWHNDANPSSLNVLLDWLTDHSNASRYFGHTNHLEKDKKMGGDDGVSKDSLHLEFQAFLRSKNGQEKKVSSIRNKIHRLISSYKQAVDWKNCTGQGVEANEGYASMHEALIGMCPHFDILDPILSERPNFNLIYDTDRGFLLDDADLDGTGIDDVVKANLRNYLSDSESSEWIDPLADHDSTYSHGPHTITDASSNREPPTSLKRKVKQLKTRSAKKASVMSVQVKNDSSDTREYLKTKNEMMKLQHEMSISRFNLDRERFEMEKKVHAKREMHEQGRYDIETKLLRAEANMKIAQSNAMMRLEREKWVQTHPDATEEFLDENYPLATPIKDKNN